VVKRVLAIGILQVGLQRIKAQPLASYRNLEAPPSQKQEAFSRAVKAKNPKLA
jgi:hypothetical protein